jgi:hypothetical protein
MTISQTVWVPKGNCVGGGGEATQDPSEKVWIPDDFVTKHDQAIMDTLGQIDAGTLADHPFPTARMWMHALALEQKWNLETSKLGWKAYKDTHELPKGIPYNPEDVYRNVGWLTWEDYVGLSEKKTWSDIQVGEMMALMRSGQVNVFDHTHTTLRQYIELKTTRKLPVSPRMKWNSSLYTLADQLFPGISKCVFDMGKYPNKMYSILANEHIQDSLDFEAKWADLHVNYPHIPGIPTEVWGESFWANYELV